MPSTAEQDQAARDAALLAKKEEHLGSVRFLYATPVAWGDDEALAGELAPQVCDICLEADCDRFQVS